MATINVRDGDGNPVAIEKPLAPGRVDASSSRPVALSTEDKAALDAISALLDGAVAGQNVVIAINASMSGAIDVGNKAAVGIMMPAGWDAAALTFQGSVDGAIYGDVYDTSGAPLTVQAAAARYIVLDPSVFVGLARIKIRSGTSGSPVNQTASRTLVVATR